MIIKSLDPLRGKKTFIRKKFGHTIVSAFKASSVTLIIWQKEPEENTVNLQLLLTAVISKTDMESDARSTGVQLKSSIAINLVGLITKHADCRITLRL